MAQRGRCRRSSAARRTRPSICCPADSKASNEFSELILALAGDGAAILMATHDLYRARETGTRIGIMREGVLRAQYEATDISHTALEQAYLEQMLD